MMHFRVRNSLIFLCIASFFVFLPSSKGQSEQQPANSASHVRLPQPEQAVNATSKRPMTFVDMMKMKRLGETTVSSDGKWLAYSVTTVNLQQNTRTPELWLQKIEGGEPMKLSVGMPGDSGIQFAPFGKQILFLSGREGGQQVWLADFDPERGATSNPRKLTGIATEADNAKWSPDGKSIAFTSAVYPDCAPITVADFDSGNKCNADHDKAAGESKVKAQIFTQSLYRHWNRWMGEKKSHIFLVAVDTGAMRDLNPGEKHDVPPFSVGGGGGFDISPDSKELAFTEKLVPDEAVSTNADIFTLDLSNPAAKPVKVSTAAGGDWSPAYSPDGKWLAWRSQERDGYESDKFRLMVYDREKKTARGVIPAFPNWIDDFVWGNRTIFFTSGDRGESPIFELTPENGAVMRIVSDGEYSGLHVMPAQYGPRPGVTATWSLPRIIATRVKVDHPAEVKLVDISDVWEPISEGAKDSLDGYPINHAHVASISHLNDELLSQLDLPKMESFWFTAKDGVKVQGFLVRPPNFDASKKYPLKFLIHGGPESDWGDAWSYRWNAELLAANGYVVIMINPRGSTGYGQEFTEAIVGDWGGKSFTDLMTGLDYAEEHYPFIDKNRECALGASYGGYMANWILGHTDRFKCIVTHDGMFNPESVYGATEEQWFNEWEFKGKPWDYYGKPDSENPYRKWSPAMSAKNFKTPTLVVHSQLDYRLDVSEGFQLFDTLQRLGVPSKMLYFPDEGHWVLKPQNSQLWYKTVNEWVDEWTKAGTKGQRGKED
jgi:dipeptidyl aminopeptidase/acylaminoacyl peptidase